MTTSGNDGKKGSTRKASGVRLLEGAAEVCQAQRRAFLRGMAARGVAAGGMALLFADGSAQAAARAVAEPHQQAWPGVARPAPARVAPTRIVRDFADPYLEVIRLLREASEIEHALMLQYLYGAFSLKPRYAAVAGNGKPTTTDLLGVGVQEMQHLREVNSLLVTLGAAPHLIRQDFPYEPDIYPFDFNLEPLSQKSLAKYVYTEAPKEALDRAKATSPADRHFVDTLEKVLGKDIRPNHVGSLYEQLIRTLAEYIAQGDTKAAELTPWLAKLEVIQREGEDGHYKFFRQAFLGTHEGFGSHPGVWSLAPGDPAYPSLPLPVNPSAFLGHENQIQDPVALSLAWLGNVHYWIILLLVDLSYREEQDGYAGLAKAHMMGPFWAIARHLPRLGSAIPCEPLSTGYSPCRDAGHRLRFLSCMVSEAQQLERELGSRLPADYPLSVAANTLALLDEERVHHASVRNEKGGVGDSVCVVAGS